MSLLARELESEGLGSELCWVWAGCVLKELCVHKLGLCCVGGWRLWGVPTPRPDVHVWVAWLALWPGMVVGSERVRNWCVGGGGGAVSHHGEGADVTTAPSSHADSITRHMLSPKHMLGTHPLTDRLAEAPPGWEALVWTPCCRPQEGSPLALLEPILSSNHPMPNCTEQT